MDRTRYGVRPKRLDTLSEKLGIELWVQEDYRLPFPFAGNKWVKIIGAYGVGRRSHAYITNGGISSNHCRSLAMWTAFHGHRCHLVLHDDNDQKNLGPLAFLDSLGATYTVVHSSKIAETIAASAKALQKESFTPEIVPGGGHTSASIRAYAAYACEALENNSFDYVFHASGTGGTQAGICIANEEVGGKARVVGISVARTADRGKSVIREAIRESSGLDLSVCFRDDHIDGGYGPGGIATEEAVIFAGRGGLVLDSTYTGKAFAGLLRSIRIGEVSSNSKVLFWHTGGLYLVAEAGLSHLPR